jgi:homocysteine S-methyltransferase
MSKTAFASALERSAPLIIDGGLATQLEAQGCDISNPLWSASLLLEQPREIIAASRAFLDAGAECIATASYQASYEGFSQQGISAEKARELMLLSVELALQARGQSRALIAASIGPYGAMLHDGSEYRGDYEATSDETIPSIGEARVLAELLASCDTPAWVSFSCPDAQHISDGTPVEEAAAVFRDHPTVLAVGLNCTPAQYATELVRRFRASLPGKAVIAYPNSGETWDAASGTWSGTATPLDFAAAADDWVAAGASIVGGCCRTGPGHIAAIGKKLRTA